MDADQSTANESVQPIHPALAAALAERGYDALTAVQEAVLAQSDTGADLLVSAQTGSGKTVAFGLAIARTLLGNDPKFGPAGKPLAVIIAPTRELALQVQRELDWLYAEAGAISASSVGGMDVRTERRALGRGAHIVVGTPGRLRDHITKGVLDVSAVRAVVLDEADEMLDLGFREDLEFILEAMPAERRTLMFSATVPPAIEQLAKRFQRDAVRLTATAKSERHADIDYQMLLVAGDEREQAIINALLFYDSRSSIVFCHTREAVNHLTARLANRGFAVVTLSGELSQAERNNALQAMRDGRARVCVATDVAARGLDLPMLDLVVHADLPSKPDTLLHRSGRTGRAGRKGTCVLIVPAHRRATATRVLRLANVEAQTRAVPTYAQIEERFRAHSVSAAVAADPVAEDEAEVVTELLAQVSPEQLAALYLRQQRATRPLPEDVTEVALSDQRERATRTRPEKREFERERETPRERKPDMRGGTWFTLSLGRKHRADPKWLLPMICNAGGVSKADVGSIKIGETETRFEIAADRSEDFMRNLGNGSRLEKGITIVPAGRQRDSEFERGSRPPATRRPAAVRGREPRPEQFDASETKPAAPTKPSRPKKSAGDSKAAKRNSGWDPAGQQPRKRRKENQ